MKTNTSTPKIITSFHSIEPKLDKKTGNVESVTLTHRYTTDDNVIHVDVQTFNCRVVPYDIAIHFISSIISGELYKKRD